MFLLLFFFVIFFFLLLFFFCVSLFGSCCMFISTLTTYLWLSQTILPCQNIHMCKRVCAYVYFFLIFFFLFFFLLFFLRLLGFCAVKVYILGLIELNIFKVRNMNKFWDIFIYKYIHISNLAMRTYTYLNTYSIILSHM